MLRNGVKLFYFIKGTIIFSNNFGSFDSKTALADFAFCADISTLSSSSLISISNLKIISPLEIKLVDIPLVYAA